MLFRSRAAELYHGGMDQSRLRDVLRHTSERSTETYIPHAIRVDVRAAAMSAAATTSSALSLRAAAPRRGPDRAGTPATPVGAACASARP